MKNLISMSASVLLLAALSSSPLVARQVRLEVSVDRPMLLAEKKESTFVKIGLTGFEQSQQEERVPVNVALVLDKSGSMSGDKIAKARDAAIAAIERLGKNDIVSVIAYDSTVKVVVPATRLTDKRMVIQKIRQIGSGGSTALFAGVSKGAQEIRKFHEKNRVNRIILLSDGLANVGPQSPSELGDLGASLMKEGIAVSTMGLGLDFNEDLMTRLAERSGGNHVFIEKAADLVRIFNYEFNDVLSVVAQEVAIEVQVAAGLRPVRVLNSAAEINGQQVIVQINQLYAKQEKYVLLEVEVPPSKSGKARQVAEVQVSYANMQTKTTDRLSSTVSVNFTDSTAEVEKYLNTKVRMNCVLQIANDRSKLAIRLRDRGDIEGARRELLLNNDYLNENAKVLKSDQLKLRANDNYYQSQNLDGKNYAKTRKLARQQQLQDQNQQAFEGTKR